MIILNILLGIFALVFIVHMLAWIRLKSAPAASSAVDNFICILGRRLEIKLPWWPVAVLGVAFGLAFLPYALKAAYLFWAGIL